MAPHSRLALALVLLAGESPPSGAARSGAQAGRQLPRRPRAVAPPQLHLLYSQGSRGTPQRATAAASPSPEGASSSLTARRAASGASRSTRRRPGGLRSPARCASRSTTAKTSSPTCRPGAPPREVSSSGSHWTRLRQERAAGEPAARAAAIGSSSSSTGLLQVEFGAGGLLLPLHFCHASPSSRGQQQLAPALLLAPRSVPVQGR